MSDPMWHHSNTHMQQTSPNGPLPPAFQSNYSAYHDRPQAPHTQVSAVAKQIDTTSPTAFSPQQQVAQQQLQSKLLASGPGPSPTSSMAHNAGQSPMSTTPTSSQQRPQFPTYQPPTTPEGVTRERERVTAILQVNAELLQHISKLQIEGQGGQIGVTQVGEQTPQPPKQPSQEYVQCMRALQSNIAFCAGIGDAGRSRQGHSYPGPVIMYTPAKTPALVELYQRMQALFPDWKGVQGVMQRQQQQQHQPQHQPQQQQQHQHQHQHQQQMAAQERARQQFQQLQQQQQHQQQHGRPMPGQSMQGGYNANINLSGTMMGHPNG